MMEYDFSSDLADQINQEFLEVSYTRKVGEDVSPELKSQQDKLEQLKLQQQKLQQLKQQKEALETLKRYFSIIINVNPSY